MVLHIWQTELRLPFSLWMNVICRLENITWIVNKTIKVSKSIHLNIFFLKKTPTPELKLFYIYALFLYYEMWKSCSCLQLIDCVSPALSLLIKYWSLPCIQIHTALISIWVIFLSSWEPNICSLHWRISKE